MKTIVSKLITLRSLQRSAPTDPIQENRILQIPDVESEHAGATEEGGQPLKHRQTPEGTCCTGYKEYVQVMLYPDD